MLALSEHPPPEPLGVLILKHKVTTSPSPPRPSVVSVLLGVLPSHRLADNHTHNNRQVLPKGPVACRHPNPAIRCTTSLAVETWLGVCVRQVCSTPLAYYYALIGSMSLSHPHQSWLLIGPPQQCSLAKMAYVITCGPRRLVATVCSLPSVRTHLASPMSCLTPKHDRCTCPFLPSWRVILYMDTTSA